MLSSRGSWLGHLEDVRDVRVDRQKCAITIDLPDPTDELNADGWSKVAVLFLRLEGREAVVVPSLKEPDWLLRYGIDPLQGLTTVVYYDDDFLWWTETGFGECRDSRSEKRYSCRNAAEIHLPWGNLDNFRVEIYGEATVVKP